jgi:hypothetical protein
LPSVVCTIAGSVCDYSTLAATTAGVRHTNNNSHADIVLESGQHSTHRDVPRETECEREREMRRAIHVYNSFRDTG